MVIEDLLTPKDTLETIRKGNKRPDMHTVENHPIQSHIFLHTIFTSMRTQKYTHIIIINTQ